jgi:hypothetical protein
MMQPGDQSFHSPTCSVPTQGTTVLGRCAALAAMSCDCLDAVTLRRISIQAVAGIGLLADQSQRGAVDEAVSEGGSHKLAFVRRSAFDSSGEGRTVILGESDDFRPLATLGGAHGEARFLASEERASMKASSRGNLPGAGNSSARTRQRRSGSPSSTRGWKRRWQAGYGRYLSGSSCPCASVPKTHQMPSSTAPVSCHGQPRPSARRLGRKIGSMTCYWASPGSHRPRMPSLCLLSYPAENSLNRFTTMDETSSRKKGPSYVPSRCGMPIDSWPSQQVGSKLEHHILPILQKLSGFVDFLTLFDQTNPERAVRQFLDFARRC